MEKSASTVTDRGRLLDVLLRAAHNTSEPFAALWPRGEFAGLEGDGRVGLNSGR